MEPEVVKLLLDKQTELLTSKMEATVDVIREEHQGLLENMRRGFVDGDLDGHRQAHEQLISEAKWRSDMKGEAQKKLLTGGIGAVFAGLAYIIVDFFKGHAK